MNISNLSYLSYYLDFVKTTTQHSLLEKINFNDVLDKGNSVSTISMDLSKAFDTLNHDLLTSKLEAYSFSAESLSYINNCLNERLQKTNVNNNFRLWKDLSLVHFCSIYKLMTFPSLLMGNF